MPLFQFSALDSAGREKRGTIEAGTQQEAFAAIQRYGLHPTNVFAVNQAPGSYPALTPLSGPARPSSGGGVASIILSSMAILLALAALGWQLYRYYVPAPPAAERHDPLGRGLSAYDFSTPKNAYVSRLKINLNRDLRAQYELNELRRDPELQEQLRTLDVRKEQVWKDTIILFITYEKNGVKQYVVRGVEKDPKTQMWLPRRIKMLELRKDDPALAEKITSWQKDGKLD